jgi:ferritin-like metal-binding protein YciE
MENTREKTARYLKDLHAATVGTADIFEGLSRDGDLQGDLRQQAASWLSAARGQAGAIETRLHAVGSDNSSAKDFVNGLIAKVSDLTNIGHDDEDKLTQDLIKAYSGVAILVGSYESLRAFATTSGDAELAGFARQGRQQHEGLAKSVLAAIGAKAPDAADNASDTAGSQGVGTSAGY